MDVTIKIYILKFNFSFISLKKIPKINYVKKTLVPNPWILLLLLLFCYYHYNFWGIFLINKKDLNNNMMKKKMEEDTIIRIQSRVMFMVKA